MCKPWNNKSAVSCCQTCDGYGEVASHRQATINDPFPTNRCEDCDGPHTAECPVCGFDQQVKGADCFACETIAMLWPEELKAFDADKFTAAIKHAYAAALANNEGDLASLHLSSLSNERRAQLEREWKEAANA